jgi:hypothetical protein
MSAKCSGLRIFAIAFFIRLLPEFLSGAYPVGYDLLAGYAPSLYVFPDDAPLRLFGWAWSPLTVYILWFFWKLSNVDLFLFLKIAGPVFYGMFVLAFYHLLYKGLCWSEKKSFVIALLFSLQPAVLRTGWDQLREELGFAFLFLLLTKARLNIITIAIKKPITVLVLSILVVLSHQLAAVLLFVVFFWQGVNSLARKNWLSLETFIVFLPSIIIFILGVYEQFIYPNYSDRVMPIQPTSGTELFVFTNYFLSDPRFLGGDYWKVLSYVGGLSLHVVVPLLPLAVKGFFRDKVFTPMLIWLCIASYSIIIYPWFALSYYWWWILLLPIPLTVYVGNALEKIGAFAQKKHFRIMLLGFLLLCIVSVGYVSSVIKLGYLYAYTYMPSGLVESSVIFEDIPDIIAAFSWINEYATVNALIIVPEKFQGFALMYLRLDLKICVVPPFYTLDKIAWMIKCNENLIYAIWYMDEIGHIKKLENLATFGNIAVYLIII